MSHIKLAVKTAPVPEGEVGHSGHAFIVHHDGYDEIPMGPGCAPDLVDVEVPHDRTLLISGHIAGSEILVANDPHVADVLVAFVDAVGTTRRVVIRRGEWAVFRA